MAQNEPPWLPPVPGSVAMSHLPVKSAGTFFWIMPSIHCGQITAAYAPFESPEYHSGV